MKKLIKLVALICALVITLTCSACEVFEFPYNEEPIDSTAFATPQQASDYSYSDYRSDDFKDFINDVADFSAKFTRAVYNGKKSNDNYVVSPVSVFSALALAAACTSGDSRQQILDAFGMDYQTLKKNFPILYSRLNYSVERDGRLTSQVMFSNSIWMNSNLPFNESVVDELANNFYSHGYLEDFENDNAKATKDIENFISNATKGLIEPTLDIPTDTLALLINTLYLKDVWSLDGEDLPFTSDQKTFTKVDGTTVLKKLLKGYYEGGKPVVEQKYSHFYAQTSNGYKIKFIVPNHGYTLDDAWTPSNIEKITTFNSYETVNHEKMERYYTRCLFPEFKADYDKNITGILKNTFGIKKIFNPSECDMSPLTPHKPAWAESVTHVATLTVDKTGIEGAAVTMMLNGAAGPDVYTDVYFDLLVDKAFGFIVTDSYNIPLFTGTVNNI